MAATPDLMVEGKGGRLLISGSTMSLSTELTVVVAIAMGGKQGGVEKERALG